MDLSPRPRLKSKKKNILIEIRQESNPHSKILTFYIQTLKLCFDEQKVSL